MDKVAVNFTKLPQMFFSDNHPKSEDFRKQLVKNYTKISECNNTNLENIFFSDNNIDLINKQLILQVWKQSDNKFKIEYQDKQKLLIVMQYVFLEYAKHLPYNIKNQIKELNCITVGEILPNVITNAEQKIGYLQFIERKSKLLELPINSSINKTLPSAF